MNKDFLLQILACPKCNGNLIWNEQGSTQGFVCEECALLFPVKEDIPIFIIEEALSWPINKTEK